MRQMQHPPPPPVHPGGESLEDEPRSYQTCVHPAQEPPSTDVIQRRDSTAPGHHPDLESSPVKTRGTYFLRLPRARAGFDKRAASRGSLKLHLSPPWAGAACGETFWDEYWTEPRLSASGL